MIERTSRDEKIGIALVGLKICDVRKELSLTKQFCDFMQIIYHPFLLKSKNLVGTGSLNSGSSSPILKFLLFCRFGIVLGECFGLLCDSGGGFPGFCSFSEFSPLFRNKAVRCDLKDGIIGSLRANDIWKPLGMSAHPESSIASSCAKALV